MNKNKIFTTLGASNHTEKERQKEDFYATDPIAGKLLLDLEELSDTIIDNSYGAGHLMQHFIKAGKKVIGYDIIDRGNNENIEFHLEDWLSVENINKNADIVCNPPYSVGNSFVEKSLELLEDGRKVCAFLKIQFLEGKARRKMFDKYPPKRIWVSSSRILCAKNGNFEEMKEGGSAVAYAWYVWEKGYKEPTELKWFN